MAHNVTLLDDDDFDLDDDTPTEIDFSAVPLDRERTERYRAMARARLDIPEGGRVEVIEPDIAAFFSDRSSVNAALRRVMQEMKRAA